MTAPDLGFKEIDNARKILGLREKAALAEIKGAYRDLTRKWHPDKCKKKDKKLCHEKMIEINKAYKIILKYIENYCYRFSEEKIAEESPAEMWQRQYGHDPLWGRDEE